MSPEKLVRMANQIATFFRSQPGDDQAARLAGHLRDYWDPSMRAELKAHIARGGDDLDPLVRAAAPHL